jgi:hypothetical protein
MLAYDSRRVCRHDQTAGTCPLPTLSIEGTGARQGTFIRRATHFRRAARQHHSMTLRVDVLLEGFLLVPEECQASLLLASLPVPAVVGGGIGRSLQTFPKEPRPTITCRAFKGGQLRTCSSSILVWLAESEEMACVVLNLRQAVDAPSRASRSSIQEFPKAY